MPLTGWRRARFSPRRCRTKHLPLLRFEEPPCVEGKLPQLDPFFRIGVAAMRNALLVVAVHGVNAPLKPVMLGAQADEGCLLQAAWVEVRGLLVFGRLRPWTQARLEVGRLPLRTAAGLEPKPLQCRWQAGTGRARQRRSAIGRSSRPWGQAMRGRGHLRRPGQARWRARISQVRTGRAKVLRQASVRASRLARRPRRRRRQEARSASGRRRRPFSRSKRNRQETRRRLCGSPRPRRDTAWHRGAAGTAGRTWRSACCSRSAHAVSCCAAAASDHARSARYVAAASLHGCGGRPWRLRPIAWSGSPSGAWT